MKLSDKRMTIIKVMKQTVYKNIQQNIEMKITGGHWND